MGNSQCLGDLKIIYLGETMKKFIIAIAAVFAISANAQEHKAAEAAHHDAAPAKAEKKAKKAAKKEEHKEAAHAEGAAH
jgi:hypothetical protein